MIPSTIARRRMAIAPKCTQRTSSQTPARQWSLFRTKPATASPSSSTESHVHAPSQMKSTATPVSRGTSKDIKVDMQGHDERGTQKLEKTVAQIDEELRMAMEGRAGDGGESGIEMEDGKAVSMKRGVRDNMFRYI